MPSYNTVTKSTHKVQSSQQTVACALLFTHKLYLLVSNLG